jgi:hypothetical protein
MLRLIWTQVALTCSLGRKLGSEGYTAGRVTTSVARSSSASC